MKVTTQLKDIVSFSKGEQIKGSDLLEEGPYDYLNGGITPSGKWNRYNTPKNTVTVSEGGNSCGYVNYMDRPFWCGAHCYYLFNSKLDNKYLYYALKSQQNRLMKIRSGACMPNIKKSDLGAFKLTYETNELEQKEIVKRLDKVKLVIDLRKAELQQLDELVKSRFVEMFGDPVINPYNWATKPFLETGTCKNGMNFHYDDAGVELNCLGVGDFKDFSIIDDTSTLPMVSLNEMPSTEYLLQDGDIVFVRSNGNKALVGRSIAVYPKDIPTTFSGFCIRYRKFYDALTIPYLLRVLKSNSIRKKMMGRGANIQNLNQQILSTIVIPIPPIDLQNEFATFVKQVDKSKFCVTNYLRKIQLIKGELL